MGRDERNKSALLKIVEDGWNTTEHSRKMTHSLEAWQENGALSLGKKKTHYVGASHIKGGNKEVKCLRHIKVEYGC